MWEFLCSPLRNNPGIRPRIYVVERPHGTSVCQQAVEYVSAQHLGHLYVYQVRCVDDFRFVLQAG